MRRSELQRAALACPFPAHRYKLLRPAPAYATTHADVQRKLDLCARSAHILRQRPDLRLEVVGQLILHPSSGPMGSMGVYTVQDLQQEAPFMVGQLAMLAKVRTHNITTSHCS